MRQILFVNACVRKNSRTRRLADTVLSCLDGNITEVNLNRMKPLPMGQTALSQRESALACKNMGNPIFASARQFAQADEIVIAAPYWDLFFPAVLKIYLENICIPGITFQYENGMPKGLCRAKRLLYVTTSGGYVESDLGFTYLDALCKTFFSIPETHAIRCQGLDIWGNDPEKLLSSAQSEAQLLLNKT